MKLNSMEGKHVTVFLKGGMVSTNGILTEIGAYGVMIEFKDTYEFFSYHNIDRIMVKKPVLSGVVK
ncbi:hypothetical protein [Bacillus manliponensis]|uniref:hypothetical protein n=1 Tax=Bacillus manliponensis TaxID=574376 RepID=UPI003518EFCF